MSTDVRILKFEADWCAPCRFVDQQLDTIQQPAEVVHVDIEKEPGITALHRVRAIPTLVFFVDGEERARLHGRLTSSQIDEAIVTARSEI